MTAAPEESIAREGFAAVRGMRAAFVFLSRIPLGGFPYSSAAWHWAPAHFPLVGLVVGALSGGAYLVLSPVDRFVAAVVAVGVSVWLTGAFHEDGLADSADALGGSHGNERLFEILKDSRIGTYGAVALLLSLLLRVAALAALGVGSLTTGLTVMAVLVFVHALARTGPVWLIATMQYVAAGPAKGTAVSSAGVVQALVATGWTLAASLALLSVGAVSVGQLALALAVAAAVTALLGRAFQRRAGGITGDFLGATEQAIECSALLALLVARAHYW